jgi:hypothetical protein
MDVKLCECGCGQPAPIAKLTNNRLGYVKGGPKRFVAGHQMRRYYPTPEVRFWAQVQKTDGCWLWTGATVKGYGAFFANGKSIRAHRYSYQLHHGPIPSGKMVLHHCDTPACVRPDHIYAGTNLDNVRDAMQRGRTPTGDRNGSRLHPEKRQRGDGHWARRAAEMPTKGEGNGNAKLNRTDIEEIRRLYASGKYSQSQLGRKFGITQTSVGRIVNRLNWKHVE